MVRKALPTPPNKARSSQPMKMPSRALPPSSTPRQPPLVKGTSQPANVGARSPRLKETVLPKKFRSSQPMKMPSPTKLPTVVTPPAKGKSRSPKSFSPKSLSPTQLPLIVTNRTTPKLGGELPAFKTMTTAKPRKTMASPKFMSTGEPSSSKYVQRSARENTGMPGTRNYVQRAPRENIGMPSSSKFVRRTK